MEVLQRLLQDKANEVKQLQKKVSDVEREKHTELVKLRLEVRMLYPHIYTCRCEVVHYCSYKLMNVYTQLIHPACLS